MTRESAFRILDLGKNPTGDDIKRAYRRKAFETHPDKGGKAKAFSLVADAYAFLTGRLKVRRQRQPVRADQWVQVVYTSSWVCTGSYTSASTF